MSQNSQPSNVSVRSHRTLLAMIAIVAIALIAIAGFAFTSLSPHMTTVTQQQIITNTQSLYNTQTVTTNAQMMSLTVVTGMTTVPSGYGPPTQNGYTQDCGSSSCVYPTCNTNGCSFQICGPNGCSSNIPGYTQLCGSNNCSPAQCGYNGCYYTTCQTTGQSTVQCAGYLQQSSSGCIEVQVPVANYVNNMPTMASQFYTLQNLPSSYPSVGTWVTVTGQLHQGANTGPNGAACPGNYMNVTSIS